MYCDMSEDDDADLYGDLADLADAKRAARPAFSKISSVIKSTQEEKELQQELENLRQENETLKRNIGTLYRTARAEIKRKDAKIESLMEALDRQNAAT